MGCIWISRLKTVFSSSSFNRRVGARTCPLRAMLSLWCTGLLLSFLTRSACLARETSEDCVSGIIGRSVVLPCLFDALQMNIKNFSIEWRRGSEVVLRSVWGETGDMKSRTVLSSNSTLVSTDAPETGDFSLELTTLKPQKDINHYRLFVIVPGEEESAPVCTVCLRVAGFSYPVLRREDPAGGKTVFICHSIGGFPEPVVHWLINDTVKPPVGSFTTFNIALPDSALYNVTSKLTVNISQETSVSCIIEYGPMNETLTTTSPGVNVGPVVSRASEAMWVFSTVLSVAVGLLVLTALVYQIYLDRLHKKRKKIILKEKGRLRNNGHTEEKEETKRMNMEHTNAPTETDV